MEPAGFFRARSPGNQFRQRHGCFSWRRGNGLCSREQLVCQAVEVGELPQGRIGLDVVSPEAGSFVGGRLLQGPLQQLQRLAAVVLGPFLPRTVSLGGIRVDLHSRLGIDSGGAVQGVRRDRLLFEDGLGVGHGRLPPPQLEFCLAAAGETVRPPTSRKLQGLC